MPSCSHCGAPYPDAAATSCPRCGTLRAKSPTWGGGTTGQPTPSTHHTHPTRPTTPGYIRVGPTVLPSWLPWLLAVLLIGGGIAAYAVASSAPDSPAVDFPPSTTDPYTAPPTAPGHDLQPNPTAPDDLPTTPDPTPTADSPSALVERFYAAINAHDFATAWELGGKNIGGAAYGDWVAGYGTTRQITVSAMGTTSPDKAGAVVRALQNDGTVKVYQGTYTVSDGTIVDAEITAR
ncbi:hypothetical protein ACFU7T_01715 [Streptomyces sp. NPDC057555]|uniref:hypothetical protein n=1 Tax=Streptomyces sp. NPDC057555 TaxID=3346166 RepID=UPI0036BE677F